MESIMPDQALNDKQLLENLQKFLKITFAVMTIALIVGGVGGWLVYENHSSGTIYKIELLIPVIIAACIAGVGVRVYRSKLFSSKQEFKQASDLFKQKMEAKK